MIVVAIQSGLGNQLFQYAFAKAVKKMLSQEVFLADHVSGPRARRAWGLNHFNIDLPIFSLQLRRTQYAKKLLRRAFTLFSWKPKPPLWVTEYPYLFPHNHVRHAQPECAFTPEYYRQGQDILSFIKSLKPESGRQCVLDGYWQSVGVVNYVRDELMGLTFISQPSVGTRALLQQIQRFQNPVALHMRTNWQFYREGLTLEYPLYKQCVLPLSYYQDAIQRIRESYPNPTFVVFADDIQAAAATLNPLEGANHFIYADATDRQPWEDLFLMQHCKHFILSNSTFCWWGHWFAMKEQRKAPLCIMPRDWLGYHTGELLAARLQVSEDCIRL